MRNFIQHQPIDPIGTQASRAPGTASSVESIPEYSRQTAVGKLTEEARVNQFSNSILELENKFEAINYAFFRLLVEKVPDITRNEKVLCAYLKMNMSQAEIAELLQKSTNSVHASFSRLRQKFAVQTNTDLLQILNNLGG